MSFKTKGLGPQMSAQSHTFKKVRLTKPWRGENSCIKHRTIQLHITGFNARNLKSYDRLVELKKGLIKIKWDIHRISETKLPEEKCTVFQSGHIFYQYNEKPNTHLWGVSILIHKWIKHLVAKMATISEVIYISLKCEKRTVSKSST